MQELMRATRYDITTLHFRGEIVGSDLRPQFLVREAAKCNISTVSNSK